MRSKMQPVLIAKKECLIKHLYKSQIDDRECDRELSPFLEEISPSKNGGESDEENEADNRNSF